MKFLVCGPGEIVEEFEKHGCIRDGPSICEGPEAIFQCVALKTPNGSSWDGILQMAKELDLKFFSQGRLVGLSFFCPPDFIPKARELAGNLWNFERIRNPRILSPNGGKNKNGRTRTF